MVEEVDLLLAKAWLVQARLASLAIQLVFHGKFIQKCTSTSNNFENDQNPPTFRDLLVHHPPTRVALKTAILTLPKKSDRGTVAFQFKYIHVNYSITLR